MKSMFSKLLTIGLLPAALLIFSGCAKSQDSEEPAPNTGNVVFEHEKAPREQQPASESDSSQSHRPSPYQLNSDQKIFFVYTNQLYVRSTPENNSANILGRLALNDQVRILADVPNSRFVQIEIVMTHESIAAAPQYFVSRDYLSDKKNTERAQDPRSRFFVIVNVATEKLRVYEKGCESGPCPHKMILEADVAVGEKTHDGERMTVLGYFHITDWIKFYQDAAGTYPSWFDPALPLPPAPHSSVMAWTSHSVLPKNSTAKVRGAFGWYTALVGPNAHNQWTHGTLGWGVDKDKYIRATRGFWANLFTDPRSHGCTRTDNETIAYLRHLLPVGTPLIKVYAVENLADSNVSRSGDPSADWKYILTKRGVRTSGGEDSDRDQVLAKAGPESDWLEQGTYSVHLSPTLKKFKSGSFGAKSGKNGNVYGLDQKDMRGEFLIDQGLLSNYSHPVSLTIGGYGGDAMPGFVQSDKSQLSIN